jgi:ABC-2 type transport system ATP-binding protein
VRPDKRVALKLSGAIEAPTRALLERTGVVVELAPGSALLRVKQEDLREAVGFLLGLDVVTDLTVEDPPLEEVMRELFAGPVEAPSPQEPASSPEPAA